MSLINQMLKDLDARHESDARSRLHREVRALPAGRAGLPVRTFALAGGGAVLLLGIGGWLYLQRDVPASAPAPAVSMAAAPAALSSVSPTSAPVPPVDGAAPASPPVLPPASDASMANDPLPLPVGDPGGMKLSVELERIPSPEVAPRRASATPVSRRDPVDVAPPAAAARPVDKPAPVAKASAPASVEKRPSAQAGGREQSEADYRRAMTLVNGARIAEATDVLLDSLRRDGGHTASRQLLARLLIEQRRLDEAAAILAEGLALHPGQVGWAMTLARLQVERGDLAAAARVLQSSEPYANGNADYLGFAGHVLHRLGQHRAAAERYLAATRIAPGEGRWWLGLGLALEADHRGSEAREAFVRARASGSLNPDLAAVVDQKLR